MLSFPDFCWAWRHWSWDSFKGSQRKLDGSHPLKIWPRGISLKAAGWFLRDIWGGNESWTKLRRRTQNIISLVRKGQQWAWDVPVCNLGKSPVEKGFTFWLLRTAMITAGPFNFRGSPVFQIYHQEVVTDASSFLRVYLDVKSCKRYHLLPTHP